MSKSGDDRFHHQLSTRPAFVIDRIAAIVKRSIYDIPKLGTQIFLKGILDDVMQRAKRLGVPTHMSYNDQARFVIGHQHQKDVFL